MQFELELNIKRDIRKLFSEEISINEQKSRINIEPFSLDAKEDKQLKSKIIHSANKILERILPYTFLCLILAEYQLIYQEGHDNFTEKDVLKRGKEIYNISPEYHEICWQISKLQVYFSQKSLTKTQQIH